MSPSSPAGCEMSAAPADAFAEDVIRAGAAVRVPDLLARPRERTLYRVADRHGVAVVALGTTGLTSDELAGLLRFRLAQYLDIGFVDRELAHARAMRSEPAGSVAAGDVHVVAGVPETGEILCYVVVEQPPSAPPGSRLRSDDRDLFPVEQVHGAGLYHRVPILRDLPVAKVRELGRFVRNRRPSAGGELAVRAVVEVGVAVFRIMSGALRMEVDAVIGDLEESVAKHNLDFFHVPTVVLRDTVPYPDGAAHLYPRYQLHTVHPFACLVSDIGAAMPRLRAVEDALALPGEPGLLELLRLKADCAIPPSALCPDRQDDGSAPRGVAESPGDMAERRRLRERGAWLRRVSAFSSLSAAEAALLGARLEPLRVAAGQVIARRGEPADALYIVESGEATLQLEAAGTLRRIAALRPGQCCGHAALLDGGEHPVTVVAATDMTVQRLARSSQAGDLMPFPDVTERLLRDAVRLLAEVDHHRRHDADGDDAGAGCRCGEGVCRCADDAATTETGADSAGGSPSTR